MSYAEIGRRVGRDGSAVPRSSVQGVLTRAALRQGRISRNSMLTAESWIRHGGESAKQVATRFNVTHSVDLAHLQAVEAQMANTGG
jgi:hypothetical protein